MREMDRVLYNPKNRLCAFELWRGSSKTTRLRVFTAKRIAYGISHTILYISRSQGHSIKSVEWIKNAVEYNRLFSDSFGLRPGSKWTGEEIEIFHGIDEYPIRIIAMGITGQIRGFNVDDFRPDLIVVDDPDGEETTSSPEQITKTQQLFFGAIKNSLATRADAPNGKLVIAQTPNEAGDLIETCVKDPQFASLVFGCFDHEGKSRWEMMFPTEELLNDKAAYIKRNQLSIWLREMECTISSREERAFDLEWIEYWTNTPPAMAVYIAIDPASSEAETADFQAIACVGFFAGKTYLLEYSLSKGKDPEEIATEFFRLVRKWKPIAAIVESVSYQRVLAWYLRNAMARHRTYITVHEVDDRRKKSDRIIQALSGRCSSGNFFIRREHDEFIAQYSQYPAQPSKSYRGKDDLLDAVAMAITFAGGKMEAIEGDYSVIDDAYEPLKLQWSAP